MKLFARLLKSLATSSWDDPQMEETKRLEHQFLIEACILFVLQLLVLWEFWSQQNRLYWFVLAGLGVEILIVAFRKRWLQEHHLGIRALTLRTLAEARDEQQAPLAAEQPLPLSAHELPPAPTKIGPLRPQRMLLLEEVLQGVLLICLPPGWFVFFLISKSSVYLGLFNACLMLPLAVVGLQSLQRARRQALAAYVLADDQGLHWQGEKSSIRSQRFSLEWAQARAFFTLVARNPGTGKWLIGYVLDAHFSLFVWWVSQQSRAQERAASEHLCRLIVTRTRLPLRDLSTEAQHLLNERLTGSGAVLEAH